MFLEAEVYHLLIVFFALVILLKSAVLLRCYVRSHNTAIMWFAGQVLLLILAFFFFYRCVVNVPDPAFSMYSEKQSTLLAYAGIFWALSAIAEIVGICRIIKVKKKAE